MQIDNKGFSDVVARDEFCSDVEADFISEVNGHLVFVEQCFGLCYGRFVKAFQYFQTSARVAAIGSEGRCGIEALHAAGAGNDYRHAVFVDIGIDPDLNGIEFLFRQKCCCRSGTQGDGHRFGAPESQDDLHLQDVFDGKFHKISSLSYPTSEESIQMARINSISIFEPRGSAATWTVDRAGGESGKKVP